MFELRYHRSTIGAMALNLRLTDDDDRMLSDLAQNAGTSKQQTLLRLIRQEWEKDEARRRAHAELDRIFTSRSRLMDRLKDA